MKSKIIYLLKIIFKPFLWFLSLFKRKTVDTTRLLFNPSPRGKTWWVFIGILLLTIFFSVYSYPQLWNRSAEWFNTQTDKISYLKWIYIPKIKEKEFRLGLDLQGGAHLVYEADLSNIPAKDKSDAMQGVRDVIERRVNFLGISEPLVQVAGKNRLIVELAGVFDVNKAIKSIGETPLLEFKEQNNEPLRDLTPDEQKKLDQMNKDIKRQAEEALKQLRSGKVPFEEVVKIFSTHPSKANDGKLGWVSKSTVNPKYIEVASKLEIGKISDVFETDNAYNIIRLNDKRKGDQVEARHLLICYEGAEKCEKSYSKDEALKKIKEIKDKINKDNFEQLVKENSTEPGASQTGGYLGYVSRGQTVEPFEKVLFALKKDQISDIVETKFGYHLIYKMNERKIDEYNIDLISIKKKTKVDILGPQDPWKNTGLSGKHLKRADVQFDPNTGDVMVGLQFNDEGKDLFAKITKRNLNKPVAIFLDGSPISIPKVNAVITNGSAVITGKFSIDEAKQLARRLNAGALPVPIKLLSQQTVGSKLGKQSLNLSVKAGIWGIILVALFMLIIYRLNGLFAIFSLLIYGILVLGIFKMIGVTLTLAGIAGFILSLGMGVDANVLIFERMKEELRQHKPYYSALEEAFRRAWPSIRDGNLSTLITCFILLQFGTSIVKGFAITLGLGIIISMFTAMIVTKNFMKLFKSK